MLSSLSRSSRVIVNRVQKRYMAKYGDGFHVHKNKYIEELNGRREITELNFTMDKKKALRSFFWVFLLPYGLYQFVRTELKLRGDRRYKDCF